MTEKCRLAGQEEKENKWDSEKKGLMCMKLKEKILEKICRIK